MKKTHNIYILFFAFLFLLGFGASSVEAAPLDDFVTTWQTDNAGTSGTTSITIPVFSAAQTYDVDWDNNGTFDESVTGSVTHDFGVAGTYTIRTSGLTRIYFNNGGDKDKLISIDQWGTETWSSFNGAFNGCSNMTMTATDIPDLSSVSDMSAAFSNAGSFDGNIGNWDVSNVTSMVNMFLSATSFNGNIGNWGADTINVSTIQGMFAGATSFNQDLSTWDTSSLINMSSAFRNAFSFNGNITTWNTSGVTNFSSAFDSATAFNQDIDSWNTASALNMQSMFTNADAFNRDLNSWNTANVTNMSRMFSGAAIFDGNISLWNTSNVTNMFSMFSTSPFNQDISYKVGAAIGGFDAWDVSSVLGMGDMFLNNTVFNQDIGTWDVSSVTDMARMLRATTAFSQDLSSWNVANVLSFRGMFENTVYNLDIGGWTTTAATNMSDMFRNNTVFDQDISGWDLNGVTTTLRMFNGASSFDQNLGSWDVTLLTSAVSMFSGATLSTSNYDALLNGWNAQVLNTGITFDGGNSTYCAVAAHDNMTSAVGDNWTISDGGVATSCSPATPLAGPDMTAATDLGISSTDNITSDVTPDFDVVCTEAGNTMTLYTDNPAADTVVGTHVCVGVGTETITATTLAVGVHNLSYTDTHLGLDSGRSPATTITIDTTAPVITITAPTKTSGAAITDTTIRVTDDLAITAANVTVDATTTATTSSFSCVQTTATQVDCTISIDTSGNLVIAAVDNAGNTNSGTETNYAISTAAPVITITAPTKTSGAAITDTTIRVTDDLAITAANVTVDATTTATTSSFSCVQTTATQVDCTISIDTSGNLVIAAVDGTSNSATGSETGYVINAVAPVITITAPTKTSGAAITDTTIRVTDDLAITAANVTVDATTTATTSSFSCVQTTATQVDCTISIDTSGNLVIAAVDNAGNTNSGTETNYAISTAAPVITITAPTKTSGAAITDTTIRVTDDLAITAANVTVDATTTATTSSFSCVQTTATQVDCTISIDTSGNLVIAAVDGTSNSATGSETGYVINAVAPVITITAPTKTSGAAITDTTIRVTDDLAITAANVTVDATTTATTSSFSCVQTTATQVDCTISIDTSGNLVIAAVDGTSNSATGSETGYVINAVAPVITSPAATSINENLTTVLAVLATDPDSTVLSYAITGGADQLLFTINASGILSFLTAPDFETVLDFNIDNIYEVEVTVDDGLNTGIPQTFLVTILDVNESVSSGSSKGGSIKFVCKDPLAANYTDTDFGRHKASLCTFTSAPTLDNPFGGERCPTNLIIHDFMKDGDTNGQHSSYNKGVVTEIDLLQTHMNRLLLDEYGNQASGPIDGIFRSLTERGVERLQSRLNQLLPSMLPLKIDGIVGPFTREALNNSCTNNANNILQ